MKPDLLKDNSVPLPASHTAACWFGVKILDLNGPDVAAIHLDCGSDCEAAGKVDEISLGAENGPSSLQRQQRWRTNRKTNLPETDLWSSRPTH